MNRSTFHERHMLLEAICADPTLPGNALKVAMTLMAFVNADTGNCYPAQRTVEDRCHLSRNTINAMCRALENRGWLRIERDVGGDKQANRYHFAFYRVREGGDHCGYSLLLGSDKLCIVPKSPKYSPPNPRFP
jgi:Helix-turn-helix domain